MKRTRSKSLKNIILKKQDLKDIWALLQNQARAEPQEADSHYSRRHIPTITIVSEGSLSTEADNDAVFDNDVLDLKKSVSIDFQYTNYEAGKKISVTLREGDDSWFGSSFSVGGQDLTWVDATFVELERKFDSIQPQSDFFRRYRWVATNILALAIGYSLMQMWSLILGPFIEPAPTPGPRWVEYFRAHPWLIHLMDVLTAWAGGIVLAWVITGWVSKMWPSIEFDFGPEHLKLRKQQRKRLAILGGLLFVPLGIEAVQRLVFG